MESFRQKILIVDDENINIEVLMGILKSDYRIITAKNGAQALEKLKKDKIDLILLDIMMPDMNGYELCRKIKNDPSLNSIPVIFVTALSDEINEYEGLEMGALDYITKPVNGAIVRARVGNHLKLQSAIQKLEMLNQIALDANPNTGLPGNNSIMHNIQQAISQNRNSTVIYADLDNFKAYNDKYGFAKGDEVIVFTSEIFQDILHSKFSESEFFIGHIGGDDFVLITPSDYAESICREIIERFDHEITEYYSQEDQEKGYLITRDRNGIDQKYSIMTISLGCVGLSGKNFREYLEVNDACAETKGFAKNIPGSSIFFDRRSSE